MRKSGVQAVAVAALVAVVSLMTTLARASTGATCCPGGVNPIVTSNGFPEHPEIVLAFWQNTNEWTSNTQQVTMGQWIGAALSFANTPYYSQLVEYGASTPRVAPFAPVYTGTAPISGNKTSNFTTQDINDIEQYMMTKTKQLPLPMYNDNTIYALILPSGSAGGCAGGVGCNYPADNNNYTTNYFSVVRRLRNRL